MQVAAPYLMTFKNPTNPYFDEESRQIIRPRAARPSDFRKRQRNEELCQQAISSGTFDFDGEMIRSTSREVQRAERCRSRVGGSATVVDVLEIEDDSVQPMEIPIARVSSTENKLDGVRTTRMGNANCPDNQIVLVSDSD